MLRVQRTRRRVKRCDLARRIACQADFRQPKIQNLGVSPLGDKDVGGLDVAVDDTFGVRCIERVCDLYGQRQNRLGIHRSPRDAMLQRHAIQKLHGNEGLAMLVVNFVNGADVRMIQRGSSFGFALKAGECLRVVGYIVRQELEGDKADQLHILGFVDHAHPTTTELFDDAVVRDGSADH